MLGTFSLLTLMYNRKIIKEAGKIVSQKKQKRIKSIILEAINRF